MDFIPAQFSVHPGLEIRDCITILLLSAILFYGIEFWSRARCADDREPPYIYPRIPIIGHAIGLLWHGGNYYTKISAKCRAPIYTVPFPKRKIYIVNSLSLILSAGKVAKKVSFSPFLKFAAKQLSRIESNTTLAKFDGDGEANGIAHDMIHAVETSLLGREGSRELDHLVLEHTKVMLDQLPNAISEPIALHEWLQHLITQVSSRSLYGPLNPFQSAETEAAFWDFEHNLGMLLMDFAPEQFKRKAIESQERVVEKFVAYYEANGQDQASSVTGARFATLRNYGLSSLEIAKLEVTFNFAVLNNSLAVLFWMLTSIFSRKDDLSRLRKELKPLINVERTDSKQIYTISLEDLKLRAPFLMSTFHEVLRVYSMRPNMRLVVEDTLLDGKYFLERGSVVQLAAKSVHNDPKVWGLDAGNINLGRFLDRPDGGKLSKHTAAFGAFGLAPYICPGRHFAASEIMAIVAQIVMRYEMTPLNGKEWKIPEQNCRGFNGVPSPNKDIKVSFVEIKDWSGDWNYVTGKDGAKFPLVSG